MGILLTADEADAAAAAGTGGIFMILIYVVIFAGFYFFAVHRPQKKEQSRVTAMLSEMSVGDVVLTTSGFYGIVIDISEDTIIVEFGSNKNCRIPMQKSAVARIEKPDAE